MTPAAARLRVALFGSPEFAVPSLEMLAGRHDLRLVVAQPDKPAGRRLRPAAPPAAEWARAHGVPLLQPRRAKDPDFLEALREHDLDLAVTAAYGKILPPELLDVPRHGVLNVHASLLPEYRGAAPVQRALIDGRRETGVSIMQTEAGLDTGPVRLVRRLPIAADDDARTLNASLALLGAEALEEALDLLARGELPSVAQDDAAATLAPRLTREDGRIRWDDDAARILDRHRGVAVWPGSWTVHGGAPLKVTDMSVAAEDGASRAREGATQPAGTILSVDGEGVAVAAGRGAVRLREVQAPGRARVAAAAWARGARVGPGGRLG